MSAVKKPRPKLAPIIIIDKEASEKKWKDMWDKYVPLLKPYYDIEKLYVSSLSGCENIVIDDPSYIAEGASKFVQKCKFGNDPTEYAMVIKKDIMSEVENHLEILYLYYITRDQYQWKFIIPNVYKSTVSTNYIMDLVRIDPTTWKNAKSISSFPPDLQENIGQFMGLYTLNYGKRLLEFEKYDTLDSQGNKSIPTLLDFGNYIKFDLFAMEEISKNLKNTYYNVPESMYNGIISIFQDEEVKKTYGDDFWKKIARNSSMVSGGGEYGDKKKYYKYKHKYLQLKNKKN